MTTARLMIFPNGDIMFFLRRIIPFCLVLSLPVGWFYSTNLLTVQISTKSDQFNYPRDIPFPLLPVKIGSGEYPFVLDTGCSSTIYDTTLRSFLSVPAKPCVLYTSIGKIEAIYYSSPPANIGHFSIPAKSSVLCMDLGELRNSARANIYGVLGMVFLECHVFRIDFDRGEVTFLRSTDSDAGMRIPIIFYDHNIAPYVQATIAGFPMPELFLVDTGGASKNDGCLRGEWFDSLCEKRILKPAGRQPIMTLSGLGYQRQGRLQEIFLGCFKQQDLLFGRSFKGSSLGINFWSRYIITFDFPNGVIYLKERGKQKRVTVQVADSSLETGSPSR